MGVRGQEHKPQWNRLNAHKAREQDEMEEREKGIGSFKETKNVSTELKYASEAINSRARSLYFCFVTFYIFQIFYNIHIFLL